MTEQTKRSSAALAAALQTYRPRNEQEERDAAEIIRRLESGEDLWTRKNTAAHLTASAWVVSPDRTRVLMCFHKLYDSWSWLGGHVEEGEYDLSAAALREVREESGLTRLRLASRDIYSVEILAVAGHEKHGQYVSSHLHLNLTYLVEADPDEPLTVKADENSGLRWFTPEEAVERSSEPWLRRRVYAKLNAGLRAKAR
jgi:8-oxo-dGTP pyrophosphatase MutT (NUDIX family)